MLFLEGVSRVEDACEGRDGWNWDPFEPHDRILRKNLKKKQKNEYKEKKATIYSHKSAKTYLSELSTAMCSQENKNKEL